MSALLTVVCERQHPIATVDVGEDGWLWLAATGPELVLFTEDGTKLRMLRTEFELPLDMFGEGIVDVSCRHRSAWLSVVWVREQIAASRRRVVIFEGCRAQPV